MLKEVLKENVIALNVKAKNYEEALRSAGELLVKDGKIERGYVDDMVNSVKELGPYIVITKGIALGHARPSEKVFEESISLITLEEPVEFGHKDNDPVSIVFALATKENSGHLNCMQELAMLLSNEETIRKINNAQDVKEILNLI